MVNRAFFPIVFLFLFSLNTQAQQHNTADNNSKKAAAPAAGLIKEGETGIDSTMTVLTLHDCVKFALKNQPALNQSLIDESIASTNNKLAFSGWLPQVTGAATFQHYFNIPTAFSTINGVLTGGGSGVYNYAIPSVTASQNLFSTDLMLAVRASKLNMQEARQNITSTKINVVSEVSKAFYDLLLSIEQISVYQEDTARLRKNKSDAYNRYISGVVDKVDYKQATISLNNSLSQLKSATEAVQSKYATLKLLMGFPSERKFTVHFDTARMLQEIYVDTNAHLQFEKRIEYQELQTAKKMQRETTMYYQLGFIPTLSAFYTYNYEFENNSFSDLFGRAYPYSLFGLQLNIPIFTGFRRNENIHKAKLQEQRIDWDEVNLKLSIYAQYSQALANYKSNLYYLREQGDNVDMAREVYNIVKLQYREGVKAYLDVIIAESDLQTSEINYLNALFQLLESKIDLEKAMGDIPADI